MFFLLCTQWNINPTGWFIHFKNYFYPFVQRFYEISSKRREISTSIFYAFLLKAELCETSNIVIYHLNIFCCFSYTGFGAVLCRLGPDDAVWHHDLSSDSLQTQPVCVLTWPTLTPSPGLSAWLFLYLAEQPCHWHSPTQEHTYKI